MLLSRYDRCSSSLINTNGLLIYYATVNEKQFLATYRGDRVHVFCTSRNAIILVGELIRYDRENSGFSVNGVILNWLVQPEDEANPYFMDSM